MYDTQIPPPLRPPRHMRLFELIRQQAHALRIARSAANEDEADGATMAEFARRAAASWHRSR